MVSLPEGIDKISLFKELRGLFISGASTSGIPSQTALEDGCEQTSITGGTCVTCLAPESR